MFFNVLDEYGTKELEKEEKQAKESLRKSIKTVKELTDTPRIKRMIKDAYTPLEWNDVIEEENTKYGEVNNLSLLFNLSVSAYASKMKEIDQEKENSYLDFLLKTKNIDQLKIDYKTALESIDKAILKEWITSPEFNKGRYESVFFAQNNENEVNVNYKKEDVELFLNCVLAPYQKAINKFIEHNIKGIKELEKNFIKEKASKEKELLKDDRSISVGIQDSALVINGDIDRNVRHATISFPIVIKETSKEYESDTSNLKIMLVGKNGEIPSNLEPSDGYVYETIRRKIYEILSEVLNLKSIEDKKDYYNNDRNFCVSIPMIEYAKLYGRSTSKSSLGKIRDEIKTSLDRLQSIRIQIEGEKFLEEMGYENKDLISFNFIESYERPSTFNRTSCFDVTISKKFVKASLCPENGAVIKTKSKYNKYKLDTSVIYLPIMQSTATNKRELFILASKLYSNTLVGNNIRTGQNKKLSSGVLMDYLEYEKCFVPFDDKEQAYFKRWRRYQKERLEKMFNDLVKEEALKYWCYIIDGVKIEKDSNELKDTFKKLSYTDWRSGGRGGKKARVIFYYEFNDKNKEIEKLNKKTLKKKDNKTKHKEEIITERTEAKRQREKESL